MIFRLNEKSPIRSITASQLEPGEMATYLGNTVLRVGKDPFHLVSLSNPQNYWTPGDNVLMVTPLSPGSIVTLEQE
jgi:hypothetical protein